MARLNEVYTAPQYSDRYITSTMKKELAATGTIFFVDEVTEQDSKHGEAWELLLTIPGEEKQKILLLGKHPNRDEKLTAMLQAIKNLDECIGPVQYTITELASGTEWHDIIDPEDEPTQDALPF